MAFFTDILNKAGQTLANKASQFFRPKESQVNTIPQGTRVGETEAIKPSINSGILEDINLAIADGFERLKDSIKPSIDNLQKQTGRVYTPINPASFSVDISENITSDVLQPKGRGSAQQRRSEIEEMALKLRQPTRDEIRARERLELAERALANIGARETAQLGDLRMFNPEGVFGGGVASREGQIGREAFLESTIAQGQLSGAQGAYDRLRGERIQSLADLQTIQSLTAPDVVGTPTVNKDTGDVFAYIKQPDGSIAVQNVGNIGADESFDLQSVIRNEATGQAFAVGTRNGQLVQIPIEGTTGLSGGASGLGSLTATQKSKLDSLETVVSQLDNYKNLISSYGLTGGSNIAGADSARIQAAKSALEFAIASAVGTGALQAADRAVVQDLIADPTSILGIPSRLLRGGSEGIMNRIDEARNIFVMSANRIGGTPEQLTQPPITTDSGKGFDDLPDEMKSDRGFWGSTWDFLTGK